MADDTFETFKKCAVEVLQVAPEQVKHFLARYPALKDRSRTLALHGSRRIQRYVKFHHTQPGSHGPQFAEGSNSRCCRRTAGQGRAAWLC